MFKNFHIVILVILFLAILNTGFEKFSFVGGIAVRLFSNISKANWCVKNRMRSSPGNCLSSGTWLSAWDVGCAPTMCCNRKKARWSWGTAYCS